MEVQNALDPHSYSTADYAVITRNKTSYEVWIGKSPWCRSPESDDVSLKDVKYDIIEGVLYIKGTQIYYYHFDKICTIILTFGSRLLFKINSNINANLVEPFVETDIYIKRWWRKNKKVRGVDLTNIDIKERLLLKKEDPREMALSNFKLVEVSMWNKNQ